MKKNALLTLIRVEELDGVNTCSDEEILAAREKIYQELADVIGLTVEEMKPSFAEEVEQEWMQTEWRSKYEIYFDLSDNIEAQRIRILRLDDVQWQCNYLSLFLKLLYHRCPQLEKEDAVEQVRFCATAYNVSFRGSYEEIRAKSKKAFFHTDFMTNSSTMYHVYADIAAYYYKMNN